MSLFGAVIALGVLALIFGVIRGFAAVKFRVESDPIVDQIDEILPQTQFLLVHKKKIQLVQK